MLRLGCVGVLLFFPAHGEPLRIDPAKLIDLTYSFDDRTVYWPTSKPFEWKKDMWGRRTDGKWYASATFTTSEHGGTHLDSPIHFAEGKMTADEIPVSRLIGPARLIDIRDRCATNRDYELTPSDIADYERRHGAIEVGDIVLVRTGWGRFWPNRKEYLGDDATGDAARLSFPGIGVEAAKVLAARRPSGVGIDTASLDYGRSRDFPTHRILNEADIYGIENIARLERLPARGATIIALPVKIAGGSGGPVRVIAILPEGGSGPARRP